jgi:hypothetical protein
MNKITREYLVINSMVFKPFLLSQQSMAGILAFLFISFLSVSTPVNANELGSFQRVEIETLDEEDFIFPEDFKGQSLNIVMLAMSMEQDNGTWQGEALEEWYMALAEQGVLSDEVLGYHFSVMKVPWFIKGLIRGGMADSYEGRMPLSQAGAIFIKDLEGFAGAPGIELDGQPTLVLVAPDGQLLELFKGEVSEEGVLAVGQAVAAYLQPEATSDAVAASENELAVSEVSD